MIWVTVSSWSCFCWLYRASPSLAAKNIINLTSVLTTWWCPFVEWHCTGDRDQDHPQEKKCKKAKWLSEEALQITEKRREAKSKGVRGASSARAKVMRKEAWHTQRQDRASGVPPEILEHLPPKPESAYFLLCAFTYTSDFTGGCPPLPLSEKSVNLQLQLIIPGCDSVSTYKLLWKSCSRPE